MQFEQFKAGLLGLACFVLCIMASGDGPREVNQLERKPMKLETKIRNLISETKATNDARFDIVAFELWGNSREGFDCNNAWHIARGVELNEAIEAARGRWEVFKVNYAPRARVSDIRDIGYDDDISLEVDGIPFLEIRPSRN
jgi:hypothetical protein